MIHVPLVGICILVSLAIFVLPADASHIFDTPAAFAQYLDTIKMSSDKYDILVGDQLFEIHYGYEGSMEASMEELRTRVDPELVSMELDVDKKSLVIKLEPAPKSSTFWLLLPTDFISAENEEYQLFIDGKNTPYDLTKFPTAYALGMIVPPNATDVEIMGTYVIPEFGPIATLILVFAITVTVILFRKTGSILPRY